MLRIAVVAALLGAIGPGAAPAPSLFAGADPDALIAQGRWWIYPTGDGTRLYAWSPADRRHWRRGAMLLDRDRIGWIAGDRASVHYLWAPHMAAVHGRYFLYYAVGPQNPTASRIGVARCAGPAGPCVDSGRALVTGGDGFEAIDPAVFVDPRSGTAYLYAGGSAGARLRAWVLKPDMVRLDHEVAIPQPPHFTEGVFVHYRRGTYYLSYSVGHWNRDDYHVEMATGPTPLGPWRSRGVLLSGNACFKGPGHHSIVEDPVSHRWYIVYHRWEGQRGEGPYRGARRVALQQLNYGESGAILLIGTGCKHRR